MLAIDKLSDELEATSDPQEVTRFLVKLEHTEKAWEAVREHEVFNVNGDLQYKFIRARDSDDRLSDNLARF